MKRLFLLIVTATMVALGVQAQRIVVVDEDGVGIPLVSVLNDDGVLLGTTNLDGVLADIRGAARLTLTHVSYQPLQVSVSDLQNGRITMKEIDFGLQEIVVSPKPYIYIETYYRMYVFLNDSLCFYQAGIMPNAYNIEKKKVDSFSQTNCSGDFCPKFGASIIWGARAMEFEAGVVHKSAVSYFKPGNGGANKYYITMTEEPDGRRRLSNPEGTLGYIDDDDDLTRFTVDGAKAQMYADKVDGRNKLLQHRQESNYQYQFTDIFRHDEDGNCNIEDFVMYSHHWEYDDKKGHRKVIIETYATDRGYMDKSEWKARKKELKREYVSPMTIEQLETYATTHHIPALSPVIRSAIEAMKH